MLDEARLKQLSPLGRRFREAFRARLQAVAHSEVLSDRYELVIPAAHPDVGELRVYDDGDELTICLGPHHRHVPSFHEGPLEGAKLDEAVESAVQDIEDVLEHRTILRVTRRNGQITSTSTYPIDHDGVSPTTDADKEYVWKGPRLRAV